MKKKGFTLIELLAVIVILAIIALIATPLIINIIDEAKKGAFKNSAYGIIKAGELQYAQDILSGSTGDVIYTYSNGIESSSIDGKVLEYKGQKPKSGRVIINNDGQVAIAIHNGKYCVEKGYNDSGVTISSKTDDECIIEPIDDAEFTKIFGGSYSEFFSKVVSVSDGYVAVGSSYSTDGDLNGLTMSSNDAIIAKFNKNGDLLWAKNHDVEENDDSYNGVINVGDGYIAVGESMSADTYIINAIMAKYDNDGNILWEKTYVGAPEDTFNNVIRVSDGYLVVGYSYSADGELNDYINEKYGLVMKFNFDDELVWKLNYGGSGGEGFSDAIQLIDGYILVGASSSTDGDLVDVNNKGMSDAIIVKTDLSGNPLWTKNFGGNGRDEFSSILVVNDGYIFTGRSNSTDGDMTGLNKGDYDAIILKYDLDFNLVWNKSYGGSESDYYNKVISVSDGYIAFGTSRSTDGDVNGIAKGGPDGIIVKYDSAGNILSNSNYGGTGFDSINSAISVGNGYVFAGFSASTDGDMTGLNKGGSDAFIVKVR